MSHDPNCLFCKISQGLIPSQKVYEDEEIYAFKDINPAAPVHFLMIPKRHITSMAQVTADDAALLAQADAWRQRTGGRCFAAANQEHHRVAWLREHAGLDEQIEIFK